MRGAERRLLPLRNDQDALHKRDPARYPRTSRTAYSVHKDDVLRLDQMQGEGFAVAVVYHSHIDAGAYFSPTDKEQALLGQDPRTSDPIYPDSVYVVVSVVGGEVKAVGAYQWSRTQRDFIAVDMERAAAAGKASSSQRLFVAAEQVTPGGVNSPVRAFRGVWGQPFFVARAAGPRLWDVDGRSYLDFVGSWGPLILGHAPAVVVEAISEAAAKGTSYGAPTAGEVDMAEILTTACPSMELVRLVSSGTEAAMSAIRVARGATGRDLIVKFDGCYHGHADSLLVKAGSGGATFSIPDSQGVPDALARMTLTAPFNDLDAVERLMAARGGEVAVVVIEPVAG